MGHEGKRNLAATSKPHKQAMIVLTSTMKILCNFKKEKKKAAMMFKETRNVS